MEDKRAPISILQDRKQLENILKDVDGRAEIFWNPFQDKVWLKTWHESDKTATKPTVWEKYRNYFFSI